MVGWGWGSGGGVGGGGAWSKRLSVTAFVVVVCLFCILIIL